MRQNHAQILQAAAAGVVVLGRNATAILADRPGALHVKLIGRLADRLARAARVDGIDAATAARRQKNEDRHRAQLTHQLYHWDATDPLSFDLVLNTSELDEQACADMIVAAWRAKARIGARVPSRIAQRRNRNVLARFRLRRGDPPGSAVGMTRRRAYLRTTTVRSHRLEVVFPRYGYGLPRAWRITGRRGQ